VRVRALLARRVRLWVGDGVRIGRQGDVLRMSGLERAVGIARERDEPAQARSRVYTQVCSRADASQDGWCAPRHVH
jgi:hypothetical protein